MQYTHRQVYISFNNLRDITHLASKAVNSTLCMSTMYCTCIKIPFIFLWYSVNYKCQRLNFNFIYFKPYLACFVLNCTVYNNGTWSNSVLQRFISGRKNRIERVCEICLEKTRDMSKHLERKHKLFGEERWKYLSQQRKVLLHYLFKILPWWHVWTS